MNTGARENRPVGEDVFGRLSPFIRDYIYRNGWTELRAVQVEACRVLLDTDHHLLLASGTASGKTEAAFLPVLTRMEEDPPSSIGVLYIAPLKALINDQFLRLNDLLAEAGIPVWHWHGDVPASHKRKLMRLPSGILQITPESLESLLINRNRELMRLFGDLRFIVVDEVHAFMGTDRGVQVQCQMARLERFIRVPPRRIGLSATLGDTSLAARWLSAGTERPVDVPAVSAAGQKFRLRVDHFYESADAEKEKSKKQGQSQGEDNAATLTTVASHLPAATSASAADMAASDAGAASADAEGVKADLFWEYIYEKSLGRRCIIFTNLREHAETAIATLRQVAALRGTPDIYHVHHGSISASLRETAETDMKESPLPIVTAATVSLELGIDVGKLERIIQVDAPASVSSFLQRLGRSGRRGNPSEMYFVCREEKPSGLPLLPYQIPWRLLQAVAIIRLYTRERWIEPPTEIRYPLNMLYHQTMSMLAGLGELTPEALARRVLSLAPFRHIPPEDFRELLDALVRQDHVQPTAEQGLIVGLQGEKIVNSHHFYAVFPEEEEYTVVAESRQIGRIELPPPPGERITLAGRTWEVKEVDLKQRMVFTVPVKGKIKTYWQGGGLRLDNRVLAAMREILLSEEEFPFLGEGACLRLGEARFSARNANLAKYQVLGLGGKTVCILPWMGTDQYHAFLFLLRKLLGKAFDFKSLGGLAPYFILVRTGNGTVRELYDAIRDVFRHDMDIASLLDDEDVMSLKRSLEYRTPKFDPFIPVGLHRKALLADHLDMPALAEAVGSWQCGDRDPEEEPEQDLRVEPKPKPKPYPDPDTDPNPRQEADIKR